MERLLLPVSGFSSREADTFCPLDVSISHRWSLSAIPRRVLMVSEGLLSQLGGVFTHAMTSLFYAEQRWGICKTLKTKFWSRGNNECPVTFQLHLKGFQSWKYYRLCLKAELLDLFMILGDCQQRWVATIIYSSSRNLSLTHFLTLC